MVRLKRGVLCNETKAKFISFILTRCGGVVWTGPGSFGKAGWRDRQIWDGGLTDLGELEWLGDVKKHKIKGKKSPGER